MRYSVECIPEVYAVVVKYYWVDARYDYIMILKHHKLSRLTIKAEKGAHLHIQMQIKKCLKEMLS